MESARALTQDQLRQMYSGRTWMWSEGGGYFEPDGTFYAVVGGSAKAAFIAKGRWRVSDPGKMCFAAVWRGRSGNSDKTTCFYHKAQGTKILQRKGESGDWYAFKGASANGRDEFHKLVPGDRIDSKMNEVRAKYLSGVTL